MRIAILAGLAAWAGLAAGTASAAGTAIGTALPAFETANLPDNGFEADADDPAVWVHPTDPARSLIALAVKDGGLRVVDLRGRTVQVIDPADGGDAGRGRINNVDVGYGLRLLDGREIDVAVASDRALDVVRVYRIRPDATPPLVEVTDPAAARARAFPTRPREDGTGAEANPLEDQNTAYGLALWREPASGRLLAAVTQRGEARIGLFRLVPRPGGRVAAVHARDFRFPIVHDGQDLRQVSEDDPRRDWSPQFEGLAVDQRTGILYAGQEDVGIWRVDLARGMADRRPFYETRGARGSSFRERGSVVARDVEGLTVYYGPGRRGYLLASSQGAAHGDDRAPEPPFDDTFAVFALDGARVPSLVGSFRVTRTRGVDAVQESDGADVLSLGLPGFPGGLFVTQDGYDDDLDGLSGETDSTNFKLVPWERIARSFSPPLLVTPRAYDPRRGTAP